MLLCCYLITKVRTSFSLIGARPSVSSRFPHPPPHGLRHSLMRRPYPTSVPLASSRHPLTHHTPYITGVLITPNTLTKEVHRRRASTFVSGACVAGACAGPRTTPRLFIQTTRKRSTSRTPQPSQTPHPLHDTPQPTRRTPQTPQSLPPHSHLVGALSRLSLGSPVSSARRAPQSKHS